MNLEWRDCETLVSVGAGAFAGLCSTCVSNPLDTIRVRLSSSRSATGTSHKSLLCTTRELFSGGVRHAFGHGLGANIMASIPSNAIYLPTYRTLKTELALLGVNETIQPTISACGAVTVTNMTLAPIFLVRTRVQVDDRLSVVDVFRSVMRKEGIRGFYRGTCPNIAGRFVEEGMFWTVYELLKIITQKGNLMDHDFLWSSAAMVSLTVISKLIAVSIAFPYNVVMNHLRTVNKFTGKHEFTKVLPTVRHIYRADGLLGFYKGLAPQILRSLVSKATQIYAFELVMFGYARLQQKGELCPLNVAPVIETK